MTKQLRRWVRGAALEARRLNEVIDVTQDLAGQVNPPRTDDVSKLPVPAGETWTFVSRTTRTERIEDADDSEVYVDVLITSTVTVQKPDGSPVTIQLEDPSNG